MAVTKRVTNSLRNNLRDRISTLVTHTAVGTDATTPAETQTALVAELLRKAATASVGATGEVTHVMRILASEANGQTLREVGEFDAAGGGTMWARLTHSPIVKDNTFEVEYRIKKKVKNP